MNSPINALIDKSLMQDKINRTSDPDKPLTEVSPEWCELNLISLIETGVSLVDMSMNQIKEHFKTINENI